MQLTQDRFRKLCDVLTRVSTVCHDVIISNGHIVQTSDDKAILFSIDLSPIIDDMSINIGMLEQKLKIMKIMTLTDDDIDLSTRNEGNITYLDIKDERSTVSLIQPSVDLLTVDSIDISTAENIRANVKDIVVYNLDLVSIKKLLTSASSLNLKAFNIICENDAYDLCTIAQSGDQKVSIVSLNKTGDEPDVMQSGNSIYINTSI